MAAPIPAPPANPTTAPMAISAPRPRPHKLNEVFELEHLDAATPIPAPAPAPTTPKIRALRRRWLLSRTVTRATFSLRMPMSFDPSWIWIASSVTVEKVPLNQLNLLTRAKTVERLPIVLFVLGAQR